MTEEKKERFELDFAIGKSGYFLRESSSGMVGGPKQSKDGVPRHLTIPLDEEGNARNIHMKSGRGSEQKEDWRIVPDRVLPDLRSWILKNSAPIAPLTLREIDKTSYSFSVRRIIVTFSIVQPFLIRGAWLMARGLCVFRFVIDKKDDETRLLAFFDPSQLAKLAHRLRPVNHLLTVIAWSVVPQIIKRIAKLHTVPLNTMSEGDICLTISKKTAQPVVVVKYEKHVGIPLEHVIRDATDFYSKLKLSEMMPELGSRSGPFSIHFRRSKT